jgi:hypothetical protein
MASRIPPCPEIHRYSRTQQFARINCVIPALSSDRERPRVTGLGARSGHMFVLEAHPRLDTVRRLPT